MKMVNNFVQTEKEPFKTSVRAYIPSVLTVPFCQSKGKDYICIVKEGESVKEGQPIAIAVDSNNKELEAQVHSPIPGTVTAIENCSLPDGCVGLAAKIQLGGEFSFLGKSEIVNDWKILRDEEILTCLDENGIINTFSTSVLLSKEIRQCKLKENRFLVLRLFDEDPSRMTDSFVAENFTSKVLEGAQIIAAVLHAQGIVLVKPKKVDLHLNTLISEMNFKTCVIDADTSKYPQGFKQNLIHTIRKVCKSSKNSLYKEFMNINHKSIFVDPETALSVYEAVVNGRPLMERYVHVTGNALKAAGMFRVRIGSTIQSLASQCGGFKKNPSKIVINGLIIGNAVSTMQIPVTKDVKSISFLTSHDLYDQTLSTCIRCGKCREVCPENIYPDLLFRHKIGGKPVGEEFLKTSMLCSGCSICNCVCPSRLPLCQTIELIKGGEK